MLQIQKLRNAPRLKISPHWLGPLPGLGYNRGVVGLYNHLPLPAWVAGSFLPGILCRGIRVEPGAGVATVENKKSRRNGAPALFIS